MPFYSQCTTFVAGSLPQLVAFGGLCTAAGVTVPPSPPAGGGASMAYYYVEVTLALANANIGRGKKLQRFQNEFRGDVAEALNVDAKQVANHPFNVTLRALPSPCAVPICSVLDCRPSALRSAPWLLPPVATCLQARPPCMALSKHSREADCEHHVMTHPFRSRS